jgi:hypothetical protein
VTQAQADVLLKQGEAAYRAAHQPFPKEGTATRTIIDQHVLSLLKLHAEERVVASQLGIRLTANSDQLQSEIENTVAAKQHASDAEIRAYYRTHVSQYRAQHLSLDVVRLHIAQYLIGRKRDGAVRKLMSSVQKRCAD